MSNCGHERMSCRLEISEAQARADLREIEEFDLVKQREQVAQQHRALDDIRSQAAEERQNLYNQEYELIKAKDEHLRYVRWVLVASLLC